MEPLEAPLQLPALRPLHPPEHLAVGPAPDLLVLPRHELEHAELGEVALPGPDRVDPVPAVSVTLSGLGGSRYDRIQQ